MNFFEELLSKKNAETMKLLPELKAKIEKIISETENNNGGSDKEEYFKFFNVTAEFIRDVLEFEKNLNEEYFEKNDFEKLLADNHRLYEDISVGNYGKSYTNPQYAVAKLGDGTGQLLSVLAGRVRGVVTNSFHHNYTQIIDRLEIFTKVYDYVKGSELIEEKEIRKILVEYYEKDSTEEKAIHFYQDYSSDYKFFKNAINASADGNLKYLFRYGVKITENEIKTAKFFAEYPVEKLKKLADVMVAAYFNSFYRRNKEPGPKKTVKLFINAGQERFLFYYVHALVENGFKVAIGNVTTTAINPQYGYDHKFDASLFMSEDYARNAENQMKNAMEMVKDVLSDFSGMVMFMKFGEKPFEFVNKKECLRFSEEQQEVLKSHQNNMMNITDKYISMKDSTQNCIAFPTPEIGENFEKIFEDTFEINMLDTEVYEEIQQKLIDVIDEGDHVHVKGYGKNQTDIRVKLHELDKPDEQTNFINCGCDLNIPVGEVFTSPKLKGTNGILHIRDIFLWGSRFKELKLKFVDGFVAEYECQNYETKEENDKYILENLLFPHKTLPLGEFAIGTNTHAYVMARKYDIMSVLPILIIEKMGPHFAIGDTCFFRNEESKIYNRYTNKHFIAVDNEKSILRKTKPEEAYTYKHTDITLPYESIDFISVVREDGTTVDLLRDGRFVLPGTESLNAPLDSYFK